MTADEFVGAVAGVPIRQRRDPAFAHPPDPVLDLLARYDTTGVAFWQFEFTDAHAPCFDGLWHVATKTTDTYYVEDGQLLHMYYKSDYPRATGLSSGQFLDVIVVYARMIAAMDESPADPADPRLATYADEAAAVSPHAAGLDWFWESSRR